MKTTIFYHANCADGFGAAWAAWKKLGEDASYHPVQHGAPPPDVDAHTDLYILDFCYSRSQILDLKARCHRLQILDHHRTAEEAMAGLDFALFDNQKSGAVLAWEHFHPDTEVPELLRYIMDRDLWLYRMPKSREVSAALASYPMNFDVWSRLDVSELAAEGVPILRYQREVVTLIASQARMEQLDGHRVPVVNAAVFGSEVGEALLKRYPDSPFAVIYFDRADGKRQWSLRSREDFDVAAVARRFQNGGHRQAAGFETSLGSEFMPRPRPRS